MEPTIKKILEAVVACCTEEETVVRTAKARAIAMKTRRVPNRPSLSIKKAAATPPGNSAATMQKMVKPDGTLQLVRNTGRNRVNPQYTVDCKNQMTISGTVKEKSLSFNDSSRHEVPSCGSTSLIDSICSTNSSHEGMLCKSLLLKCAMWSNTEWASEYLLLDAR